MKKLVVVCLAVMLTGCLHKISLTSHPQVQNARDIAAAFNGVLTAAQDKYVDQCNADRGQHICIIIYKAVDAQNALITAIQTYCGWSQELPTINQTGPCAQIPSAELELKTAINNANLFITELKGVVK
jgi:hypothetical protein